MNQRLAAKIKALPISPGVYLYKNAKGEVIYVGKAVVLKKRVKQYFSGKLTDRKTSALIAEINDVDTISVETELDALFLESELVKRYMPKFNILLRDDKSAIYIKFSNHRYPVLSLVHLPTDDGAQYFGPYFNSYPIRTALRYLRWIFPYLIKPYREKDSQIDQAIGLSPQLKTLAGEKQYLADLNQIKRYINGERTQIINELGRAMQAAAKIQDFEAATKLRNQIYNLKALSQRVRLREGDLDLGIQDETLLMLKNMFNFNNSVKRIEGFDISHTSGTNVVASMVVFSNGISDRSNYRKLKIKIDQNDDFYNMAEAIKRRLKSNYLKKWGFPDLILIDGGKGQLSSALKIRDDLNLQIPMIGLAKRDEELIIKKNSGLTFDADVVREQGGVVIDEVEFWVIKLPEMNNVIKLFRRVRDEAHRFAISYHSQIRTKQQTASQFDQISGIGPKTKSKLTNNFKNIRAVSEASLPELAAVIGAAKAKIIYSYFANQRDNLAK